MVVATFIDKNNNVECFAWDSNYICEYEPEELEKYPTIIVYDVEYDKLKYKKINGTVLFDEYAE